MLLQQHGSDDSYRKPVQAKNNIRRLRPDIAVPLRSVWPQTVREAERFAVPVEGDLIEEELHRREMGATLCSQRRDRQLEQVS